MVLHKRLFFMNFYFIFVFLFPSALCSYAERKHSNSSIKSVIIHEMKKKISDVSLNLLSKATPEKKETILNKIENKLKHSAIGQGTDGEKYIKLIMDEFKQKSIARENEIKNDTNVLRKTISMRADGKPTPSHIIDPETKQAIVKDIANKIQILARGFMKHTKTLEGRQQVLEKIKTRIMDSAKQKHDQLHKKHDELRTYSSLIVKGLDVSMQKLLAEYAGARRMESKVETELESEDTFNVNKLNKHKPNDNTPNENPSDENTPNEFIQNVNTPNENTPNENTPNENALNENTPNEIKKNNDSVIENDVSKNALFVMDVEEIEKYKKLIEQSLNESTIDPRCDEIVEDTCLRIRSLIKIPCGEGKSTTIENLCNGVIDCVNQVDEVNCTAQAIEKVRKAAKVMKEIEDSFKHKCFALTNYDDHLLTTQNQVLRDVLQTQIEFLMKHVNRPVKETENKDEIVNEVSIKKALADVNTILSTLSYALEGTLCAHRIDPDHADNKTARKYNDIEVDDIDEAPLDPTWSPKSCHCNGHFCKEDTCKAACKRVCWQRYSLNHFGCQAIGGGSSVPLNAICDGKMDCFDETDESDCASDAKHSKFESLKSYSNLLKLLSTKSQSHEFQRSRNKMRALLNLVQHLQKETLKANIDIHTVKSLRDESFMQLVSIYEEFIQTASLAELDDRYLVLLSLNEKLVTALKRSHTGNDNMISSGKCYCRDGHCALRRCNKNCNRACLAEPVLTRFPCNVKNITVPIETICNGKKNCPNGEDEKDCIRDVCRAHHLVVLRHNLQNVESKHRQTAMGEVLNTWKTKVSASLFIAETTERPNHKRIIDLMERILHDLVMAFAAMEDQHYRKSNSDSALQEFRGISKIVMNTLKSCSN